MENLTGGNPPVRPLPCVVPCKLYFEDRKIQISIHALLAESDDITDTVERMIGKFLSTLSLRRATRLGL